MVLKEGTKAPDFKLLGNDGKEHSLSEHRGKLLVLYFYPKDETPGCIREACGFRDSAAEIRKMGAEVMGISADSADSHQRMSNHYKLNFTLLADTEMKTINDYGVYGRKNIFGKLGLGIIRSTFLIGKDGVIKKVFSPVRVDGHDAEVVEALKQIRNG